MTFLESLFGFLFKYRPLVFQRGDFVWGAAGGAGLPLLVAAILAVVAILTYGRVRGKSTGRDRALMAGLRFAALAVLALLLLRPTLVVSRVVPQRNFVAVLLDDSRSMRIPDAGGERARGAAALEAVASPESRVGQALAERFTVRYFRFASDADRTDAPLGMAFEGTQTRVGDALERVRTELAGVPLSGIVLVSDGADTGGDDLSESLLSLRSSSVPVFTVGVGREELEKDIQLSRVETPRRVLRGSSLVVDLVVTQRGFSGRTVPVRVEEGGRILAQEDLRLPDDGEPATVRVAFTAEDPGARTFRFVVPAQEGERIPENNVREAIIDVRDERQKVLYLEGEPRFEVKFLRRAVADDDNLQLVVLQRTAEGKFLRLDVDHADELAAGFPTTREDLFEYRGLILGSVEASFFTHDQLRMIAEFAGTRGGGLLALGGRRALAEGGYAGTPVAEALPFVLEEASSGERFSELAVRPTPSGLIHPAVRLASDEDSSARRWRELPAVSTVNRVGALKPAATALLTGSGDGVEQPVLAYQRYGRGKAMALPIQDSWIWQMHADIPLEDETHETFWRQLLRWLVDGVPDAVTASVERDEVEPGEALVVRATVDDSAHLAVNDARVSARVTTPTGAEVELPLDWTIERDGEYVGRLAANERGTYEVRVTADRNGAPLGEDVVYARAEPSNAEYFEAGMRRPLLERVAEETGGRFYSLDGVDRLPTDIDFTGAGLTVKEELALWDMPILFLLLMGLVGAEWAYRRRRGLP